MLHFHLKIQKILNTSNINIKLIKLVIIIIIQYCNREIVFFHKN